MLPRKNRLKKEKEIKRALAGKIFSKSALLICKAAANELGSARFCFVVSKKISNKAVVRNKVKRRLREAIKALLPRIKHGFDCVLIALPGIEARTYREIWEYVYRVLAKSGILKLKRNSNQNSISNDK